MRSVFFALVAAQILAHVSSDSSTTQIEVSSSGSSSLIEVASSSSISQVEVASSNAIIQIEAESSSSTTQIEIASSVKPQETAEQQENVGISSSLISQQTTLIADNTEPVISAIEEYTTHDSDAYWEKTTLHHYNNRSVLESVTVVNGSLVLEEGYINTTYAERFAYLKPGGDAAMSCNIVNLQFDTQPTKIVYKWINRNGLDMEAYPREGGRIKVTSHFELKIETAEPEDSDNYFCIVSMEYPDRVVNFTNELHFKVYVDPDIGLEFPFIFEASSCNVYKDQAKMDDIRKSLCRETPCLYELRMECSTTPWFLKDVSYVSKTILQVTAIKFPHPSYLPPQCKRDCVMANKFDHIQTNMESLQKTIAEMVDTESLIFLREETWKRRQVVYVCESGYELHRENCVPCLAGQYNPLRGISFCLNCPVDTYQDHAAQNACIPCATDYGTSSEGSFSPSACYHTIHLIRFTMPFFIVCGIVLGLVLVCFALLMVKYNHLFVLWIYSRTAKKVSGNKQKAKVKEKVPSQTDVDSLKIERLLDFLSYTTAAQATYNTSRGQTRAKLAQANQELGIRGQEAFPVTPQAGKQFTLTTTTATAGSIVGQSVVAPSAPLPLSTYGKNVAMPSTGEVPPGGNIPLSYPIPPGVIVSPNVALPSAFQATQGSNVPPGFSVPPSDAIMPTQKQTSFHKTASNTKMTTQEDQGISHHIPSNVNMSAQRQPSFYEAPLITIMQTQKESGSDKIASSTKTSIKKQPSSHRMLTPDQAANVPTQTRESTRRFSTNLSMETRHHRTKSRSVHDTNVNHNAFTVSNQQHHDSKRAAYFVAQNRLLLKSPERYRMLEPNAASVPNKHSFHSPNIGIVESQSRNANKRRHARHLAQPNADTVERSNQVNKSRGRHSHRKKTALNTSNFTMNLT